MVYDHHPVVRATRRLTRVDDSRGRAPLDVGALVGAWRSKCEQGLLEGGASFRFRAIASFSGRYQGASARARARSARRRWANSDREPSDARPAAKSGRRPIQAGRAGSARVRAAEATARYPAFTRSHREPPIGETAALRAQARSTDESRTGMSQGRPRPRSAPRPPALLWRCGEPRR
jgi:hypothetical protein